MQQQECLAPAYAYLQKEWNTAIKIWFLWIASKIDSEKWY